MRIIVFFLVFLCSSQVLSAKVYSHIGAAYKAGHYEEALNGLLEIETTAPRQFDLMYNIGNTYYKLGELGEAMTYYYRAARLRPRDKNLRENMRISQDKVVDDVDNRLFIVELLKEGTHWVSINDVFSLFLVFFLLSVAGAFYQKGDSRGGSFKAIYSASVCMSIVFFSVTVFYYNAEFLGRSAVIIERKVAAKSGPSETLKTQFFVHEGVRIKVVKVVNGWAEIYLSNGFRAWVKEASYWDI